MLDPVQRAALDYAAVLLLNEGDVYVEPDGTLRVSGKVWNVRKRRELLLFVAEAAEAQLRDGHSDEFISQLVEELRARGVGEKKLGKLRVMHTLLGRLDDQLRARLARYEHEDAVNRGPRSTDTSGET